MARGGMRKGSGRKPVENKRLPVSVSLSEIEVEALDYICKVNGVSRSYVISMLILETHQQILEKKYLK